jgi:glucose-6-phosphate dehydrogenase assembly protein OpcA
LHSLFEHPAGWPGTDGEEEALPVGKKFTSLTAGVMQPANVANLEEELSELWRSAAEDPETDHPVMRACVLTLLVYVENERAGHEALEMVSQIIAQNPCRAIIMIAEENQQPEGLTSGISAQCHLPASGARQVCCEQIFVRARGEAVKGLDNIVVPLVIPELPVYLWWKTGRFAPPAFLDPILRITNRVLVDSGRFEEPEPDLAMLARQVGRFKGTEELAFSDLNWARLTPCRELIAQCFDSAETSSCLDDLAEVRLEWEQGQGAYDDRWAQALLLTAWLASRLGWQPAAPLPPGTRRSQTLEFQKGEKQIRVECRAGKAGSGHPAPFSVILKTSDKPAAQFSIIQSKQEGRARTRAEIPGRLPRERTVRLHAMDQVGLVNEELKFPGHDRIYEEALSLIAQMFKP